MSQATEAVFSNQFHIFWQSEASEGKGWKAVHIM